MVIIFCVWSLCKSLGFWELEISLSDEGLNSLTGKRFFFCLDIFDTEIRTNLISCVFPASIIWFSVYAVLFLHWSVRLGREDEGN